MSATQLRLNRSSLNLRLWRRRRLNSSSGGCCTLCSTLRTPAVIIALRKLIERTRLSRRRSRSWLRRTRRCHRTRLSIAALKTLTQSLLRTHITRTNSIQRWCRTAYSALRTCSLFTLHLRLVERSHKAFFQITGQNIIHFWLSGKISGSHRLAHRCRLSRNITGNRRRGRKRLRLRHRLCLRNWWQITHIINRIT